LGKSLTIKGSRVTGVGLTSAVGGTDGGTSKNHTHCSAEKLRMGGIIFRIFHLHNIIFERIVL